MSTAIRINTLPLLAMRLTRTKLLIVAVCCMVTVAVAQTAPSAPLPTQLAAARKVFLSNASNLNNADARTFYDSVYTQLTAAKHFELVLTPAEADVVIELQHESVVSGVSVSNGNGSSDSFSELRLTILDPRTHVPLWTVVEFIGPANRKVTADKNFLLAITKLVTDLNDITAVSPTKQ